ncbi:MAG: sugar phosphate isomerase/epimerase, partial [Niabella sp.]
MKHCLLWMLFAAFATLPTWAQQSERPAPQPPIDSKEKFKVGMAGYTFVNFDIDKALETLEKSDVHYLCIKDFHLPISSTDAQIAAFHKKLKDKNVTGYGVGPIYMKTKGSVDTAFEYAKRVGV